MHSPSPPPSRLEIDKDNYKLLDSTKEVSLLASSLKLFFRELPEPLITRQVRDALFACAQEQEAELGRTADKRRDPMAEGRRHAGKDFSNLPDLTVGTYSWHSNEFRQS